MASYRLPPDAQRGITWRDYVSAIGEGEIVSRSDMAARFDVSKSTAAYHLDRAASEGSLNRRYGFVGRQPGWLYAHPSTMPMLIEEENHA